MPSDPGQVIVAKKAELAELRERRRQAKIAMSDLLFALRQEEAEVIRSWMELGWTLKQIGEELGMSKQAVYQLTHPQPGARST